MKALVTGTEYNSEYHKLEAALDIFVPQHRQVLYGPWLHKACLSFNTL